MRYPFAVIWCLLVTAGWAAEPAAPDDLSTPIAALDDPQFEKREQAKADLLAVGQPAYRALYVTYQQADQPERRARIDEVLQELELQALQAEELEPYLVARRRVLFRGPSLLPKVDALRNAQPANSRMHARLSSIRFALLAQAMAEPIQRAAETALKRADELRKSTGSARIVALIDREITFPYHPQLNYKGEWISEPYAELCYFDFVANSRKYGNTTTLMLEQDVLRTNMLGGQEHRIKDMGAVNLAEIEIAPANEAMSAWAKDAKPAQGHVYIVRTHLPRDGIDRAFKFKILDLDSKSWVVIQWDDLPRKE